MQDLTPPECSFASDNYAGALPEVLDALAAANAGPAAAYGDDPWTARAVEALRERFDAPVEVRWCWGGTGANVVGLASILQPWQAVIAPACAHVVTDECGAFGRFSGSTLLTVPDDGGKLRPEQLDPYLQWLGSEHHPQPGAVTITQSTELGTLYTVDEIAAIAERAHAHGLLLHLDGARLANALAALDTDLATLVRDTGVDVCTVGFTKAGALYGEAVVYLRPELAARASFVRKQAGQLPSKSRFVAAQVLALLEEDRWVERARHANAMAARLADAVADVPGVRPLGRPAVNALFVELPAEAIRPLQDWSFFWEWDLAAGLVRWMTSWATTEEDVARFAAGVRALVTTPTP